MTVRTPVLIVGAGPIGLTLAGELAWRGIGSTLIERTDGTITQPKMDLVGVRTMEFCRRWGIASAVENGPYNRDHPQDYAWVSSLTGWEFGREPFPSMRREQPPLQSPQKRERCPQDMFDPILRRWVAGFPDVDLRYKTELLAFKQDLDGVTACVRRDGTQETVRADYLIGSDGGASTVRQALGISMTGKPTLTYTTNAIFHCPGFWSLHDKRPGYRFIFIGPEGTYGTVVAIDGHDRFRFSIVGDDTRRTLTKTEVCEHIVRAMGKPFDFEIESILPWVRRELVADSYGHNRVYIAGDAAHLTSPTGGFGMNMGIQDSVDLGWKLAAVLDGWGGPNLLASYEAERRPVAIRNVQEATRNLANMLSPRASLSAEVFQIGPAGDAARKAFGDAYTAMMKREWHTLGIHLGYRYDPSPVVVPDGTPAPVDDVQVYRQTARPGSRAPHVWLSPGRSTLDLFGHGFVLLRFAEDADTGPMERAAAAAGVPLQIVNLDQAEVCAAYEAALVLVRPDGFVAWRGERLPADVPALLDVVRGAGRPQTRTQPKAEAVPA